MATPQFSLITPLPLIAPLTPYPKLFLSGKPLAKEDNLIAFSECGLVGWSFSEAALRSQDPLALFGLSKRMSQGTTLCFHLPKPLLFFLRNFVDQNYTGVYHVDVTIHFYPSNGDAPKSKVGALAFGGSVSADLVLPISRNLPRMMGCGSKLRIPPMRV
ncbi:hypothetical protein Fmac_011099 [Flemingia macrophylla]|uniref:Peptide N-acetyl-beta-D-glucosaminyl asparaginase amidase A N-terminal domain-containing protein n=1 Tax=Flemingia macrophylla TaxID=520843 RepID=A0ABD1MLH1_9FABA